MSIVNGGYVTRTVRLAIVDVRITHDCQIDEYYMRKDSSRAVGVMVASRDEAFRHVKTDKRYERIAGVRMIDRSHPDFIMLCEQYGAR